jgi:hypothetical protein
LIARKPGNRIEGRPQAAESLPNDDHNPDNSIHILAWQTLLIVMVDIDSVQHMRSLGKFYKGAERTVNAVAVKDGRGVRI